MFRSLILQMENCSVGAALNTSSLNDGVNTQVSNIVKVSV